MRRLLHILISALIMLIAGESRICLAETPDDKVALQLLREAQANQDPLNKIDILDKALAQPAIRNELLSQLFYERALAFKQNKDWFKAIEDFDSSVAHSKRQSHAFLEKAYCLIMLDQLEEAKRVIDSIVATQSGSAQVYILKGMVYERQGFPGKAEDEYTRALAYDPRAINALELRSNVYLKTGKPRKALNDLNQLVQILKNDAGIYLQKARVEAKLNLFSAALADYEFVEKMNPGDTAITKEKIRLYFRSDQPQKALDEASLLLTKHRDDVEAIVLQARAYIILKKTDKAEKVLRNASTKNHAYAPVYLYKGVLDAANGHYDDALENLNRSIEIDATSAEPFKERAAVFLRLEDNVRAFQDLTTAMELDPSDGEVPAKRGLVLFNRLQFDAAVSEFTKALDLVPGNAEILYNRALANYNRENYLAALGDTQAIIDSGNQKSAVFGLSAACHFAMGSMKEAGKDFDKAISLNPGSPQPYNNRGFFYFKQGDFKSALIDLRKSLELNPGYVTAANNLNAVMTLLESDKHNRNGK